MDLRSPGVGKVLRMTVAAGAKVERGDELLVIESMKVEIPIKESIAGHVKEILVKVGDQVQRNGVLARIE
jgi:biotin carboxyl carrier protein